MAHPRLLAELDDTILVEFSQFTLQEVPRNRSALAAGVPADDRRAVGGPGGIVFLSRASDHYPPVRIELWSGRPDPSTEKWDTVVELTTNLVNDVRLKSLTMEMSDRTLPLPEPGDYRAFVHVRDDSRFGDLEEGSFEYTAEQWLVQLWLADQTARSAE